MYTYIYIYTYIGVYAKTDLVLVGLNYFCVRDVYTRDLRLGSFVSARCSCCLQQCHAVNLDKYSTPLSLLDLVRA